MQPPGAAINVLLILALVSFLPLTLADRDDQKTAARPKKGVTVALKAAGNAAQVQYGHVRKLMGDQTDLLQDFGPQVEKLKSASARAIEADRKYRETMAGVQQGLDHLSNNIHDFGNSVASDRRTEASNIEEHLLHGIK
eukprot:CAMPEP_0168418266 /NCGR_PEP_ID=MMETSP0228-20121227/31678_1 /TAXON_ID=133427 /ORGANISM="Protoceratium reticulatum, Strain CCCM 535 (=CCMP 1889)" /LENGTH=138 /DNA_ID=CAMNT_0008432139 /DNA_START=18 /DNA_END=434 /DNA_ORIENTATION=-